MIDYNINMRRLDLFVGLKHFLTATVASEFIKFRSEAMQNRLYSKLFSCPLIKETSLSALSLCSILGKRDHMDYLLSLECTAPVSENNLAVRLASINGNISLVNRLLEYEQVLNCISCDENFILRAAVLNSNVELVCRLLQFQDIQREIAVGKAQVLGLAASIGQEDIFNHLLVFPEVQEQIAAFDNEALRLACKGGFINIVNQLLQFNAVRINITAVDNQALQHAIHEGHDAIVALLLDFDSVRRLLINDPEQYLSLATRCGHRAVVERLLLIPAIQDYASQANNRTFNLAITHGFTDVVVIFLDIPEIKVHLSRASNIAVRIAAYGGHLAILNCFLAIPGVIEHLAIDGNAALLGAVEHGHSGVVTRLLEFSSVRNLAASMNNQALCAALKNGDAVSASALLTIPAVINDATASDNYPLRLAATKGLDGVVIELLRIRAVRDRAAILNNAALSASAQYGHLHIFRRLFDIPSVKLAFAHEQNNELLYLAASNGHIDIVRDLLLIHAVWRNASIDQNYILRKVVKNGHTAVAACLLNIPQVRQFAATHKNSMLISAARTGNIDIARILLQIESVRQCIAIEDNHALSVACKKGHFPMVELLLTYPKVVEQIACINNRSLFRAAKYGEFRVLSKLLEYRQVVQHVAVDDNAVFRVAVANGDSKTAHYLLRFPAVSEAINAVDYEALKVTAEKGYLDILNMLLEYPSVYSALPALIGHGLCIACKHGNDDIVDRLLAIKKVRLNIARFNNAAFFQAINAGHLSIVKTFLRLDEGQRAFNACAREAFFLAIGQGHTHIVSELLQYEVVQASLVSNRNEALRLAAYKNLIDIVNTFLMFPEVRAAIGVVDHVIYRVAKRDNRVQIIHSLLNIPEVFIYAGMMEHRYGGSHVIDYIVHKISELTARKRSFVEMHRNGMFDVDKDEGTQLFYMLQYLIRRTNLNVQEHLATLLAIPRVSSMLHQEITPGNPNELLQLALLQRNRGAVTQLLAFPEVRRIAAENNYYNQAVGIDIAHIVQNHESAMVALSAIEQSQLQLLESKYQAQIHELGGNDAVFSLLKQNLEARYLSRPALINCGGVALSLPFSFAEFQQLNLTDEERGHALNAYYSHTDHTAHRFLSKPNLWIHPDAQYVEVNPLNPHLRSAYFDNYIPMIACFWLAAGDALERGSEGLSVLARQDYLIKELSMLARAHNWDRTRTIPVHGPLNSGQQGPLHLMDANGHILPSEQEEYDDGEADKPSCNMGIKQRVFRSLRDHPLFEPLTLDHIEEDMRKMVSEHYQQLFRALPDLKLIQKDIDNFIIHCEVLSPALVALNISETKINEFIQSLRAHYGAAFDSSIIFEMTIRSRFAFEMSLSHVINFYESFNVGYLLTVEADRQAPRADAAASTTAASPHERLVSPSIISDRVFLDELSRASPSGIRSAPPTPSRPLGRQISVISLSQQGIRGGAAAGDGAFAPPVGSASTRQSPSFFNRRPLSNSSDTSINLGIDLV